MLIAFEGIDGAGKSTVIEMVRQHFADWSPELPVVVTSDFSVVPAAKLIKAPMLAEQNALAQYFMIMAARVITCRSLMPQTEPGLILYDRYLGSTIAYQGSMGIPVSAILDDHLKAELPTPDLTIILDLPVATARARKGGAADGIEARSDAFFQRVRDMFCLMQDPADTALILDATGPVEEIACSCISMIKARMAEMADVDLTPEIHTV